MDRDRRLHGPRADDAVGEVDELAVMAGSIAPQRTQRGDVVVGARRSPLERHADGGELLGEPTDAHAEDHSPAGEVVERRQLLGEDHRVALRQDEDAGGEANALGRRGDVGEPDQRVGDRRVLAAGHPAVVGVGIRRLGIPTGRRRAPPSTATRSRWLRQPRRTPQRRPARRTGRCWRRRSRTSRPDARWRSGWRR